MIFEKYNHKSKILPDNLYFLNSKEMVEIE